jgi:hypothetical protein
LLVLAAAACATAPGTGPRSHSAAEAVAPTRPGIETRHSYVLSGDVLRRKDPQTLLDLVAERWPELVRGELPRGAGLRLTAEPQGPNEERFGVYDARGAYLGGPEYLANVRAVDVRQLLRLTDVDERARFGRRHAAGAVVVAWSGDVQH